MNRLEWQKEPKAPQAREWSESYISEYIDIRGHVGRYHVWLQEPYPPRGPAWMAGYESENTVFCPFRGEFMDSLEEAKELAEKHLAGKFHYDEDEYHG